MDRWGTARSGKFHYKLEDERRGGAALTLCTNVFLLPAVIVMDGIVLSLCVKTVVLFWELPKNMFWVFFKVFICLSGFPGVYLRSK